MSTILNNLSMRLYLDCIPCIIRQSIDITKRVIDDDNEQYRIIESILQIISHNVNKLSPPEMTQVIHRSLRKWSGIDDFFFEAKLRFNELALSMYPGLRNKMLNADDPWEYGLRMAIAGNIIDLGAKGMVSEEDIIKSISEAQGQNLDGHIISELREHIDKSDKIVYLGDNTGEIVFDKLFIEQLPKDKITFVVRGSPILNDALMADAEMTGLTKIVKVIDNGSDAPGTVISDCDVKFIDKLNEADVIIAKGQGNYETLYDSDLNVFFMFKLKCPIIAEKTGIETGGIAVIKS